MTQVLTSKERFPPSLPRHALWRRLDRPVHDHGDLPRPDEAKLGARDPFEVFIRRQIFAKAAQLGLLPAQLVHLMHQNAPFRVQPIGLRRRLGSRVEEEAEEERRDRQHNVRRSERGKTKLGELHQQYLACHPTREDGTRRPSQPQTTPR